MRKPTLAIVVPLALAVLLGGCGEETREDAGAPTDTRGPTPSCPSLPAPAAGEQTYDRFVLGFEEGTDVDRVLATVGEQVCLDLVVEREVTTGSVLLTASEPLGERARALLVKALEQAGGVRYAEPDAVVTVDPQPEPDQQGAR